MHSNWTVAKRYLVATALVIGSLLAVIAIRTVDHAEWPGQITTPVLMIAVALGSIYGGVGPALLSALLALVALDYLILPPVGAIEWAWMDLPRVVAFVLTAFVVSALSAKRQRAEAELQRTHEKLLAARSIQQQLYPTSAPTVPGLDIAGASFPANTVGGDYFDYIPLPQGLLGVVVADVSGHGLPSALLMAEVRAYIRALALTHDDIGEILTLLNRSLATDTEREFVTVFFAAIDLRNKTFAYAGAGHEAYLLEADGTAQRLASTTFPLGIDDGLKVPCSPAIPLESGQVLLLFTDGVNETLSRAGAQFGIEAALELARNHRHRSAHEINETMREELVRFAAGRSQHDDITMVTVRIEDALALAGAERQDEMHGRKKGWIAGNRARLRAR